MRKAKKMKGGGNLLSMLSPAAAIAQSIEAGEPVGLAKLSPLAHALKDRSASDAASDMPQGAPAATRRGPRERPQLPQRPVQGMKNGGKVRGDGVCQRGKTKGTMR